MKTLDELKGMRELLAEASAFTDPAVDPVVAVLDQLITVQTALEEFSIGFGIANVSFRDGDALCIVNKRGGFVARVSTMPALAAYLRAREAKNG